MKIAIITVNYNGKKDTLEFLSSLSKLKLTNCELKTVVVDNGSSDGSVREINTKYPEVDILQNGSNEGFSGGYNRGMIYALLWGADYILIINNDALIKDENLLISLTATFKLDDTIGLVSPKIYFAKGFEFHKDRYSSKQLGRILWYGGGKFDWKNIMSSHRGIDEVDKGKYDKKEEVDFVTGCCLMIKREVLETVKKPEAGFGFFDDNLFLYFEDSDFTIRARRAGFKTYYDGATSIYHKASQTAGIGSDITDFFHTRNRLILGFRYSKLRTKIALIREALKFLIFGRKAQRLGVWDFLMGKRGPSSYIKEVKKADYQKELSICIVNYNTPELTKKLIESIFKRDSGFDEKSMEVILLDNGEIDPAKSKIQKYLSKIKYLKNKENEGFSKGYNKTISYSKGKFILLLNSDIEVLENGISELLKAARNFNESAVLGGRLYFPDMSPQDSCFKLPSITGAFKEYFLKKQGAYFMYRPGVLNPVKVEGLVMACFLIPEKIVNKVGLLDESKFIFFEDIEYCKRLRQFKVPVYFVPAAHFIHHHGASTKKIGQEKAYKLLQKSAVSYHGEIYYRLLSMVLWLGQKLGRVKTPQTKWS